MDRITYNGATYEGDHLKGVSYSKIMSLPAAALHVNTMTAVVDVTEHHHDFLTADSYHFMTADSYQFQDSDVVNLPVMVQNAPVVYSRDGSQVALGWLKELKTVGEERYQLTAMSTVGLLTQMSHRGGIYNGDTVETVVADICGNLPYYIQNNFKSIALYGWLPNVAPSGEDGARTGSARDNLMRVLFAIGANLRTDATGTLCIENISDAVSSVIDDGSVYLTGASLLEEAPVTSVTILEHQYIAGGDQKTLFSGTTTAGQVVNFSEPMSNLVATGFTITESGANYAILSAGAGTLIGNAYIHTTREVTGAVTTAAEPNEIRLEDTTLVGITSSADVRDRLVEYYKHRKTLQLDAKFSFENPGDVLSLYDPFSNQAVEACLAQCNVSPSETVKAKISALIGFTPWQTVPFEDVRVVITSGSSYTFPADILPNTNVTAVLIGGGDGGEKGGDGEDGGGFAYQIVTPGDKKVYTATHENGQGGQPGVPGAKGAGGKILRINIKAGPGETVACAIGQGGAANGGVGGNTQFAGYTSADGVTTDDGWVEPIYGTVYGKSGNDGLGAAAGGDGAPTSYNAAEMVGKSGNDYGDYVGGDGGAADYLNGYTLFYLAAGGGGSGATASANGANSPNASFVYPNDSYTVETTGAPGISPPAKPAKSATNYGFGGDGGDAGSGGGGSGAFLMTLRDWRTEEPATINVNCSGAKGGVGGDGSAGVQGCIILYFRKPIS